MENNIKVYFTSCEDDIRDYCALRKTIYETSKEELEGGLGEGKEDSYDKPDNCELNLFMIVRVDGKCVGGMRLIVKMPGEKRLLPSESREYTFESAIKDYSLMQGVPVAEISRLTLQKEYRSLITFMFDLLREKSMQLGIHYLFAIVTKQKGILYKRLANKYPSIVHILNTSDVPKCYARLEKKRYVLVVSLLPEYKLLDNPSQILSFAKS